MNYKKSFVILLVALSGILSFLMFDSFLPGKTLFSNDGPLGRIASECHQLPQRFTGCWDDLNAVGLRDAEASADISFGLQYLLGPVLFSKFYAPIALLILGTGAWCFFRAMRLSPLACVLGGLAAALSSGFFSAACWGVASHPITVGMCFFAMAALADANSPRRWLRVIVAGLAVGMGVCEGADIGAIYSVYVAAFAMWQTCVVEEPKIKSVGKGIGRVALVAACAGLVALQSISDLVATNVEGISGTEQDAQTKAEAWNWATQWSLPKVETLGLAVPGLFGYRMDTKNGGNYWGRVGRSAAWDQYNANNRQGPPPKGLARYSGGGNYCGVLVLLLGFWTVARSLRKPDLVFNLKERKWIWFWSGVAVISLLLAFGKHAPFYKVLYLLPYASLVRNPVKFLGPFSIAITVLFAYGVDGLWRGFLQANPGGTAAPAPRQKGAVPVARSKFETRWLIGCWLVLGLSLVAWLLYATNEERLVAYMQSIEVNEALAPDIARFSIHQVGWFVFFMALATVALTLIFRKIFSGKLAMFGGVVLGVLLVADLARANLPWIVYFNYQERYQTNRVIDVLRNQAYEHRVSILPVNFPKKSPSFDRIYNKEWIPHVFPYYNVQSFEVVQLRRVPEDLLAFSKALQPHGETEFARRMLLLWQLTNTRYFFGPRMSPAYLNAQFDPGQQRFRVVDTFEIVPKVAPARLDHLEDFTVQPSTNGLYALYEFAGALPRAKLFLNWQVNTSSEDVLRQLVDPAFDPQKTVIISGGTPCGTASNTPAADAVAKITHYAPTKITIQCAAGAPSVLLLNDRYDPDWKVFVDGQAARLLHCNYLMRGVQLPPGSHQVEFRFAPTRWELFVSAGAIAAGLCLLGLAMAGGRRADLPQKKSSTETSASEQRPDADGRRNGKRLAAKKN